MDEERVLIGIDFSTASPLAIELLLEDAYDPSLYDEIAKANPNRPEILRMVLNCHEAPDEVRQRISAMLNAPVPLGKEMPREQRQPEVRAETILQRVQKLSVSERIQLALKGGK
ncbi:MAG TPA: hypothetical protein VK435_01985, partial [Thermodesulfovibrionales bacterium]|nr:hypothetical protein [Thermodesulfovibrionales bacterium]